MPASARELLERAEVTVDSTWSTCVGRKSVRSRRRFPRAEGSCSHVSGTSADAAMSLADGLLYAAKNGGRDRAEVDNLITGERVTVQPPPVSERPS